MLLSILGKDVIRDSNNFHIFAFVDSIRWLQHCGLLWALDCIAMFSDGSWRSRRINNLWRRRRSSTGCGQAVGLRGSRHQPCKKWMVANCIHSLSLLLVSPFLPQLRLIFSLLLPQMQPQPLRLGLVQRVASHTVQAVFFDKFPMLLSGDNQGKGRECGTMERCRPMEQSHGQPTANDECAARAVSAQTKENVCHLLPPATSGEMRCLRHWMIDERNTDGRDIRERDISRPWRKASRIQGVG